MWSFDARVYAIPFGALPVLVDLARRLVARRGPSPTEGEATHARRLEEFAETCARARRHNGDVSKRRSLVRKGDRRTAVVRRVTSALEMLVARARSPEPELAGDASELMTKLFPDLRDPMRLESRVLVLRVEAVEAHLKEEPALRRRLEAIVPALQLRRLFDENRAYLEVWMPPPQPEVPPLDLRVLAARLRQLAAAYVTNVIATVNGDDQATVARAIHALEPLAKLRAERSEGRARRARAKRAKAAEAPSPEAAPQRRRRRVP